MPALSVIVVVYDAVVVMSVVLHLVKKVKWAQTRRRRT